MIKIGAADISAMFETTKVAKRCISAKRDEYLALGLM